jgi:hypothetical protein
MRRFRMRRQNAVTWAAAAPPIETNALNKNKKPDNGRVRMVPRGGIEPPRCCHRRILSPLRLPIPPSRLWLAISTTCEPEEAPIIADSPAGDKPARQFAMLTLDDFDFDLPGELIAQHPTANARQPPVALAEGRLPTAASATCPNCSLPAICWCSTIRA